ncbi:MAG: hypothetical protein ACFE8U_04625 [Candidatus Hermodarchaeota archaeon]
MASLKHFQLLNLFFLFFILILCVIQENFSACAIEKQYMSTKTLPVLEKTDLGINEVVNETESVFQRNLFLSRSWNKLILNLSVQNFGDSLDKVVLQITTDGVQVQAIFNTLEQVGLIKAIAYQFEIPQSLIVHLNFTGQKELQLEIRLLLDHIVSWRSPKVNFKINKAELIGLNSSHINDNEELILLAANHQYQIQPADFSMLEKKLLAQSYFFASFPEDKQLDCTITVVSQGAELNYVSVDEEIFYSNKSQEIRFNWAFDYLPVNQFFLLNIIISPDYDNLNGITEIRISLNISGTLIQKANLSFEEFLGSHPIPGWLMHFILLIILFGIPYIKVYQEQVANQDERILDSKKQTKL